MSKFMSTSFVHIQQKLFVHIQHKLFAHTFTRNYMFHDFLSFKVFNLMDAFEMPSPGHNCHQLQIIIDFFCIRLYKDILPWKFNDMQFAKYNEWLTVCAQGNSPLHLQNPIQQFFVLQTISDLCNLSDFGRKNGLKFFDLLMVRLIGNPATSWYTIPPDHSWFSTIRIMCIQLHGTRR